MTRILKPAIVAVSAAALAASTGALAQRGGPPAGVGNQGGGPGGGMPQMPGAGRPDSFPGGGQSVHTTGSDHWGTRGRPDNPGRPDIDRPAAMTTPEAHVQHDAALGAALARSGVTLPEGGLQTACDGFASQGACISALHVAHNLELPGGFTALKAEMTGDAKLSLGAAIRKLKPDADVAAAEATAQAQADAALEAGR